MTLLSTGTFTEDDYTYTGDSEFINEGNGNWIVEFTTSGILTLKKTLLVDMYLLGGGQGGYSGDHWGGGYHGDDYYAGGKGGQGGFITFVYRASLLPGTYEITIGDGGTTGNGVAGGATEFAGHQAPGGGSNSQGYAGGALGGISGQGRGSWTPYEGGQGNDSTVDDFTGENRGGGGSGGYSAKKEYYGGWSYNFVDEGGGSKGGGHAQDAPTGSGGKATEATTNYGGGGFGGTNGTGHAGSSGVVQIRNAR